MTRRRPPYREALHRIGYPGDLKAFDPHPAGTPPLGLDRPESDIDVLCHAPDPEALAAVAWAGFRHLPDFSMHRWCGDGRPVVVRFLSAGWPVEIFGSPLPVADQPGWRHFDVERRLLALGGPAFRQHVVRARDRGLKTEPAFAAVLGLAGDPYAAMLAAADLDDEGLRRLLGAAGLNV